MYDDKAGAGVLGSSAPDTASEYYDDDEAGADVLGSSTSDTANDDETLGPVYVEAVLPMPPVGCWGWLSWMLCSRCRQLR